MTLLALRLFRFVQLLMFLWAQRLQVLRVHTPDVLALVVHLIALGDLAYPVFIGDVYATMCVLLCVVCSIA